MSFVARDCISYPEDPGVMVKKDQKPWLTCCDKGGIPPVGQNTVVNPGDKFEGFVSEKTSDQLLDLLMLVAIGFVLYMMFIQNRK